jgi:hypothetical protein
MGGKRFPIRRHHLIDKKTLQIQKFEQPLFDPVVSTGSAGAPRPKAGTADTVPAGQWKIRDLPGVHAQDIRMPQRIAQPSRGGLATIDRPPRQAPDKVQDFLDHVLTPPLKFCSLPGVRHHSAKQAENLTFLDFS